MTFNGALSANLGLFGRSRTMKNGEFLRWKFSQILLISIYISSNLANIIKLVMNGLLFSKVFSECKMAPILRGGGGGSACFIKNWWCKTHIFTRGQFWPPGIVVACVCVCVYQSLACPHDNSSPVQARITKFGPEKQNTLVKISIVLRGNWPRPSRSNLTSNSKLTPFWACPNHYSPPILVRISKFGQHMHCSTVKIPLNSGLDWPWTSPSFLIPKLVFFALWRCELRLWNSPWFVSMLFMNCFTVSTPVHMGNAQPKWNGASSAVVLNLN